MKVLEWIGKAAKPVGYIVGVCASITATWQRCSDGKCLMCTGGGANPEGCRFTAITLSLLLFLFVSATISAKMVADGAVCGTDLL